MATDPLKDYLKLRKSLAAEADKLRKRLAEIEAVLGEPAKAAPAKAAARTAAPKKNAKKKRTLSPEARAKIAAAQKRRWAKAKKTAK